MKLIWWFFNMEDIIFTVMKLNRWIQVHQAKLFIFIFKVEVIRNGGLVHFFLFHYICLHYFERILAWLMFCISLQIFRYSSKIARHGTRFQVLSCARTTKLQFHCRVSSKMKSNALQFFPVCCERYNNVKNC